MFRTMTKSFSAAALSLSLVLGAVALPATPARANNAEDIAGILAGLAALYVIGRAIEQAGDDDRNQTAHRPAPQPAQNLRTAPAQCFRDFGAVRGYLARCMQNRVARPALLPTACLVRVNTDRGPRNLYTGRCLRQNGWIREAGFRP
ncbi:MAG: hypothetical protein AAGA70_01640 [Pseudomonadota bacterium]